MENFKERPTAANNRVAHISVAAGLNGKPRPFIQFRKPGTPAGSFAPQPWWHSALHDPYERVCVWSHSIPGLILLITALASLLHLSDGGLPLTLFATCAASTHLLSALTHVFPDSISLEKLDHLGIVLLIVGTPMTALMAKEHGSIPLDMQLSTLAMLVAAFLPRVPRVVGFVVGVAGITLLHFQRIVDWNMACQLALYSVGAISFLRNGGHQRPPGCSDHHFLHYVVTAACALHVYYIWRSMKLPTDRN